MNCPICREKARVIDTIHNDSDLETYRKLECKKCGNIFYTAEIIVEKDKNLTKLMYKNRRSLKIDKGRKKK